MFSLALGIFENPWVPISTPREAWRGARWRLDWAGQGPGESAGCFWIADRRFLAHEPVGGSARGDGVDAVSNSTETTAANLVGHGVGQHFGWVGAVDFIAVLMEDRMQLGERQLLVAAKVGPGSRPQVSAPEQAGIRVGRWHRPAARGRRAPAQPAWVDRPELVPKLIGPTQKGHPLVGLFSHGVVQGVHGAEHPLVFGDQIGPSSRTRAEGVAKSQPASAR